MKKSIVCLTVLFALTLVVNFNAYCQESIWDTALNYEDSGNYDNAISAYKQILQDDILIDQISAMTSIARCYSLIEENDSVLSYGLQILDIIQKSNDYADEDLETLDIQIENISWSLFNTQHYSYAIKSSQQALLIKEKIYGEGAPECFEWIKTIIWKAHNNGDLESVIYYCDRLVGQSAIYHGVDSAFLIEAFEIVCALADYWISNNPEYTLSWVSDYYNKLIERDILYKYQCRLGIILHSCSMNIGNFKLSELLLANLTKCYYEKYFNDLTIDDKIKLDIEMAMHAAFVSYNNDDAIHYMNNVWHRFDEAKIEPSDVQLMDIIVAEVKMGLDDNLYKIFEISNNVIESGSLSETTLAVYYYCRGYYYIKMREYTKAISDLKCAVDLDSALIYKLTLVDLYFMNKEYEQANRCLNELYNDSELPNSIKKSIEEKLIVLYWIIEDWRRLYPLLAKSYEDIKSEIYDNLIHMTEHEMTEFLRESILGGYWVYDLCINLDDNRQRQLGSQMAYNFSLLQKGLILNIQNDIKDLILYNTTEENKMILNGYESLFRLLDTENLTWEEISPEDRIELVKNAKQQPQFLTHLDYNWEKIRNNLKDDEAAIEFINLLGLRKNFDNTSSVEPSICALILRNDSEYPNFVKLTNETSISNLFEFDDEGVRLHEMLYMGEVRENLYHILWEPLLPYLNDVNTVYYAPSGILHDINLDWLGNKMIGNLCDKYELYRLSSTREICTSKFHKCLDDAVLYGDISYSLDTIPLLASSISKYRSTTRTGFCSLKGTGSELDSINKILRSHNIASKDIRKGSATESTFRAISGHSPRFLHIATHGFYYMSNLSESSENNSNDFINLIKVSPVLYHSGLALAGAQDTWSKNNQDYNVFFESFNDDGILLSSEISELDLRQTDLVVLSACETGRGEVAAEGVYGLQRAFKHAGVNSIIMSLWKVDDDATQLLMTSFYQNHLDGMSKREALITAQKKIRDTPGYEDPYYWAAFILLDGLN